MGNGCVTAGKPEIALAGSIPQIGQSHHSHISKSPAQVTVQTAAQVKRLSTRVMAEYEIWEPLQCKSVF